MIQLAALHRAGDAVIFMPNRVSCLNIRSSGTQVSGKSLELIASPEKMPSRSCSL